MFRKTNDKKTKISIQDKEAIGTEIKRIIFLKDLKSNSTSDIFGPCYLGKKCKDQKCILVGLNIVCCKKMLFTNSSKMFYYIGFGDQRLILLLS